MTLSLNAISVNRALFDLKDSQLKGELTPKIVNFGGYKSSTKEWGASALNYINAANGDAKKFSALVEKMRFNSGILGNFRAHARLRQALKLQKNLKYCLKIIARDSFYSYRTGIYIPLGISLKDQKTAQKMLADLSVVGAYLKNNKRMKRLKALITETTIITTLTIALIMVCMEWVCMACMVWACMIFMTFMMACMGSTLTCFS